MGRPIVMPVEKQKPAALLREIQKGVSLKNKKVPVEKNVVADQIKLHSTIKKGVELNKVDPPNDDLSEAVKTAYLEAKKEEIEQTASTKATSETA